MVRRLRSCVALASFTLIFAGCFTRGSAPTIPDGPDDQAAAYFSAWARGDVARQRSLVHKASADFEAQHVQWRRKWGVVASHFERLRTDSAPGGAAVVRFRARHTLRGLGDWTMESELRFLRAPGERQWRLQWVPQVLHPDVRAGDRFTRLRSWPRRADLLDADGRALTVTDTEAGQRVSVGVDPRRVKDEAALARSLQQTLGLDAEGLRQQLRDGATEGATFMTVAELPPDEYQSLRAALAPLPGVFFRKMGGRTTISPGFAAHTIGRTGEITAEALTALGSPYQTGDSVGLTGLERTLERTLAGEPAGELGLIRANSEERVVVHRFGGKKPERAFTTLRFDLQVAAEAALNDVKAPAALAAVDTASGSVVALVSRPADDAFHRAILGLYPPGSTFKIVTSEAFIRRGMTADTKVSCPAEAPVGDKVFRNFEGEALGLTSFKRTFALSCNTTFVLQAAQMRGDELRAAATRFGFDTKYDAGLPTAVAVFPAPANAMQRAAAAIGQGGVLATPLHMATVAAAAARGTWRAPRLTAGSPRPRVTLTPGAAETLSRLMRAVVTDGTGKAAATVPGLMGKTGTAEFGTAQPPATHAWFVGVQGAVAFAVVVEGGGVGGRVAAPLAARFAQAIAR